LSAATFEVPANLWQYLGERKDEPFVPFEEQARIFSRVRIPWPGFVHWKSHPKYVNDPLPPALEGEAQFEQRPDGLYLPYPTVHALNCGRRFSKTTLGEKFLWQGVTAPDDKFGPPTVRMTADTEEHAFKVWDRFIRHLTNTPLRGLVDHYWRDRELVQLKNGATAQLISGNNPDALAGDGVTLWVIDEMQATQFTMRAWENLFPSTSERDGVIVGLGVCENAGPYRMISFWGADKGKPEFYTHKAPTAANPFVPRWRIALAQRTMSPAKFEQLFLAKWTNELGAVFRNVEGCINGKTILRHEKGWYFTEPPRANREYVAGFDLGRKKDWSVLGIWRPDGELVAWDRMSLLDWELQKGRASELLKHYGLGKLGEIATGVDSTGMGGDVFCQDLSRAGITVIEVNLGTNQKKNQCVDSWALRLGAGCASYPRIGELVEEHQQFEATSTETGVIRYAAPQGAHDDWVMQCAIANTLLPAHNAPAPEPPREGEDRQHAPWEGI
jgi:hypothetical protein